MFRQFAFGEMAWRVALSFVLLVSILNGLLAEETVELSDTKDERTSNAVQQDPQERADQQQNAVENKELCVGCPVKLNTDVEGLSPMLETAVKDIESERERKQMLVELIGIERQIVSGIKFSLTLKVGSTKCARDEEILLSNCQLDESLGSESCVVDFLQKPWLSKDKFIIFNNCTSKQYTYPEIHAPVKESTTTARPIEFVISDLESQIVPDDYFTLDDFFNSDDSGNDEGDLLQHLEYDDGVHDFFDPRPRRHVASSEESSEEKLRRTTRDLNTSEDSKTDETSTDSSEEKKHRAVRDINTSEDSGSTEEQHDRVRRGTKDSRAQSSLEKNDQENSVLDTLIKKNENGGRSLSSEEDSIMRHKRAADTSESSSSSSDDDDNNNNDDNNIDDKHKSSKKRKESVKEEPKKNDNNDDNDTSSSSSSSDDNNNNNHRRKRETELDREDEKALLRNLAMYITATFDKADEDNLQQIPLFVKKTKKSALEGFVYNLKLKVATSNCDENDDILNSKNLLTYNQPINDEICRDNLVLESVKLCKVRIYIPKSFGNPKILSSKCHSHRGRVTKRSVPIVGGVSPVPVDDPKIVQLTEATLKQLDTWDSPHPNKYKIVKIHEATKQLVAGMLYKIKADIAISDCEKTNTKESNQCDVLSGSEPKTCNIEILDQPWKPEGRKTEVTCDGKETSVFRSKRSMPNALHAAPHALMHVLDVMPMLDAETPYVHRLKPLKILNAVKQGEDDSFYTINMLLGMSTCHKGTDPPADILHCPWDDYYPVTKCKLVIWKYEGATQRKVKCENGLQVVTAQRKKRQVPGAPMVQSVNDPEVVSAAQNALKKLDGESIHSNKYKIIKIHNATKQLVAGYLYKINAEIILSDCPKTDSKDPKLCGSSKEAESQTCEIEVWVRPWIKPGGTETTVKCGKKVSKFISKRSLPDVSLLETENLKDVIEFKKFMFKYNVTYDDGKEMKRRFKIFQSNLNQIQMFNRFELGSAKYGVTRFADLSQEEFKKNYLGLKVEKALQNEVPFPQAKIPDIELPTEFDWREKGAVTEVKDQGSCGSCWAFSTTGNIEGQYAIKHGNLLEFSEQELVDCDTYDEGCGGGLMDNAYRAIEKLGGLELESDYPYDAKNEKCHFNKTLVRAQVTGALNISQNEDDMAKWLTVNGPIAIAINANAMQFYVGGVSHPWRFLCNPKSLDHGVLIVGYGVHSYPKFNKTLPYWTVKNSWGKRWGEQGYYKVYRGDGTCGVNQTPSSGVVA